MLDILYLNDLCKMQAKLQSKFLELDAKAENIVKCIQCNKVFVSGKCNNRLGQLTKNDKGQFIYEDLEQGQNRWSYSCVECPSGHQVAIYDNSLKRQIGNAMKIV